MRGQQRQQPWPQSPGKPCFVSSSFCQTAEGGGTCRLCPGKGEVSVVPWTGGMPCPGLEVGPPRASSSSALLLPSEILRNTRIASTTDCRKVFSTSFGSWQ